MQKESKESAQELPVKKEPFFQRGRAALRKYMTAVPWGSILRAVRRFSKKRLLPLAFILIGFAVLLSGMSAVISAAVCDKAGDKIVTLEALSGTEKYDCIMVLGCRVYADGTPSHMLYDRVKVGSELYLAGVSDTLLMSGDHQSPDYNEVDPMKETAIGLGVPSEAIQTDPYGLSTYDSVARLLEHYQGKRVVIVTQRYHLYRALYLAQKLGVEAVGVSADLRPYVNQLKYEVREVFARCKDVWYAATRPPVAGMP